MTAPSFWLDALGPIGRRPALDGDRTVDVAIAGGGYTGLWTAYYLALADPALRIAVIEAEYAGFGASGRNGGWASGLFPVPESKLARRFGAASAAAMHAALADAVDEVGRRADAEGIGCDYAKGGTITLARSPVQLRRLKDAPGFVDAAEAAERLGVQIFEGTRVLRLARGSVATDHGTVRATTVVRALEGYTARLDGHRRALAPVYSLMIATEPLPGSVWERIGLGRRETFSDERHMIIYGQRTADDRLAFGGRGAPYHFGSRIEPGFDRVPAVFDSLRQTLTEMFGIDPPIAYRWGGPLGIPRDWMPSVGLADGVGWAGGYVGDGVAAANLAGRTLADLIRGEHTSRTALPWVGHRSRRWEPEPIRWLGINAALHATTLRDAWEKRAG